MARPGGDAHTRAWWRGLVESASPISPHPETGCPPAARAEIRPSLRLGSSRATFWPTVVLPVAGPRKLRVTHAEAEHMPVYLRVFLRLLSSWVHRGEIVGQAGRRPPSAIPLRPLLA